MILELITPFNAALFHIFLIGIPSTFGLIQIGLLRPWLGLPSPCSIFGQDFLDNDDRCTPFEQFMIRDSGFRFVLHYELALVACFVVGLSQREKSKRDAAMCRYHWTLLFTSFSTLLALSSLLHFGNGTSLDKDFFAATVLYNLLAIMTSAWAISIQKLSGSNSTFTNGDSSWSIPGCALMVGAFVNFLVAIASMQVILSKNGDMKYFVVHGDDEHISSRAKASFELGILNTLVHAVLLTKLRDVMPTEQLKALCLYKLIVHIVSPLFWLPELSEFVDIYVPGTTVLRACLACIYACGYVFAGEAENVHKILTSYEL